MKKITLTNELKKEILLAKSKYKNMVKITHAYPSKEGIYIVLSDEKTINIPINVHPSLEQLNDIWISSDALHWDFLDLDLHIDQFINDV